MQYLLLGVLMLLTSLWLADIFTRANVGRMAKGTRIVGGWTLLALSAVLFVRGGAFIAVPLAFFALRLLGWRLPLPPIFGRTGNASRRPGQSSTVRTAMLEMRLDHDTGEMSGTVLKGPFAGRSVESLSLKELLTLWRDCRIRDPQSALLVETLLDRAAPDWRDHLAGESAGRGHQHRRPANGKMTVEEAYQVLGLEPGAERAKIISAHRSLMKRFHPDQGGSNYIATKINEAKDVLLASERWSNHDDN
jgi:hypothetical protein